PYTDSYLYIEGTWDNTSSSVSTNGWKIIVQNGGNITSTKKATLKINSSSILFTADGGNITGSNISISQNNESGSKIVNLGEMEYSDMNDIIGLYNYGTLTVSDYIATNSSNAEILNEGTLTINNNTNNKTSMQGTFQNSGIVTITGDLTSNTSTFRLINNHYFETYQLDIQGTIQNNCKFIVDDTAELNSTSTLNVSSGGIFKAKKMDIAGTTINLESDAILEVDDLDFKNEGASYIYGPSTGNYALARLYDIKITNWSKPTLDGNLEIESSNYPTNKKATAYYGGDNLIFVAEGESDLTIASTDCNLGENTPKGGDSPEDITFPIIESSTNVYTYLFEDCWPNLGDYDMNDIVMDIQNISYSKNAKNYIESMTITVVLRADGGRYKLAGAIQLDDIESKNISSISGESEVNLTGEVFKRDPKNGTESKQKHAVIPLFDEAHAALGGVGTKLTMTNTIKDGGNKTASKTINLTINFNDKTNITSSELSLKKLNVFIVGY
ncbi:MAG: LruC domain-containing protein, partial [Prolixibacteraceae bacterium]|nr:LruC domain-containing protein [Prolixibacteraceae bacterium]